MHQQLSLKTNTSLAQYLHDIKNDHKIWQNPLLTACSEGTLTRDNFKFIFSQYYLYSKNFTKLLTVGMFKCDNDYYRSRLSENLWEEGGGEDIELRHAEIYRKFLTNHLHIDLNSIRYEPYTELFFKKYLELCFSSEDYECAAILSFATEGIVSRLYSIFKKGLQKAGSLEEDLMFFNIHIECDDDHALTLEEMALSYTGEDHWLERCKKIVNAALDLRDEFFSNIYKSLKFQRFDSLIENIDKEPTFISENKADSDLIKDNLISLNNLNNILYQNKNKNNNVDFTVDRVPFDTDVLDPRLVRIPVGSHNELHNHAHETIFLILEGKGEVLIGKDTMPVEPGDLVFVPRWAQHQTINTSDKELRFFAVTDYGLTGRLAQNTESVYRQKKVLPLK